MYNISIHYRIHLQGILLTFLLRVRIAQCGGSTFCSKILHVINITLKLIALPIINCMQYYFMVSTPEDSLIWKTAECSSLDHGMYWHWNCFGTGLRICDLLRKLHLHRFCRILHKKERTGTATSWGR